MSIYPPYAGAVVRVRRLAGDPPGFEARMPLRFWNANYYGTHFGGSLYSMCDPFFVLILAPALGEGYAVWDKVAAHYSQPEIAALLVDIAQINSWNRFNVAVKQPVGQKWEQAA